MPMLDALRRNCALLLLLACGCATAGRSLPGVSNFGDVDPAPAAIFRGAQPTETGIDTLRAMGVRTIVDLRDDPLPWEQGAAQAAGIAYVHIPTSAWRADPAHIARFLAVVRHAQRPIFIHCRQGKDRTGLEIAVYRIVDQQWTRQDAIRELDSYGHQSLFLPGIKQYLRTFAPADFSAPSPHTGAMPRASSAP